VSRVWRYDLSEALLWLSISDVMPARMFMLKLCNSMLLWMFRRAVSSTLCARKFTQANTQFSSLLMQHDMTRYFTGVGLYPIRRFHITNGVGV